MRHLSLFGILAAALIAFSCQKSISSLHFSYSGNRADPISKAIGEGAWEKVESLSTAEDDPLTRLIHIRALFELKRYEDVLATAPITDERFASYEIFLKTMSAYEASKYESVTQFKIPLDLPKPLQERLWILHGESFQELNALDKAEALFETFLKDFKRSPFRGDVLIRLADIALSLKKNDKAAEYYEELYQFFPLTDSEDVARQRLIDAGRFSQIDTDAHLTRIQQLRKASHFERAHREVSNLIKTASKTQKPRLELALAQIHYGERKYRECEMLAQKALKQKLPDDINIEWRQILASSHIRMSQFEKGEDEYRLLLDKNIPAAMREKIFYRLGMSALDRLDYDAAGYYFSKVRSQFPHGTYIESAHWFGALTIYFYEKDRAEIDGARLGEANDLLDKLANLPHGPNFAPQAMYWKSLISKLASQPVASDSAVRELRENWPLSFHARLTEESPFGFLETSDLKSSEDYAALVSEESSVSFKNDLAWQRLELFRSVHLKTWASMELERFLDSNQTGDDKLSLSVAERLESVEDWANLVRWAEKNLVRPLKNLDVKDPVIRFHYPRAFEAEVLKQAEAFQISPFLIWGIMREESRYRSDVISAAGAVGLMQVMPNLGRRIGGILKDPAPKRGQLTDPARNIRYGTFHLSELKAEVEKLPISNDLKPVLQVAAYNAGIDAVGRWLKDKDLTRLDVFVESIPFQETRQYVKRVLQTAYIYYRLYGREVRGEAMEKL